LKGLDVLTLGKTKMNESGMKSGNDKQVVSLNVKVHYSTLI